MNQMAKFLKQTPSETVESSKNINATSWEIGSHCVSCQVKNERLRLSATKTYKARHCKMKHNYKRQNCF